LTEHLIRANATALELEDADPNPTQSRRPSSTRLRLSGKD